MVSKTVSYLLMCVVALTGITKVRSHPMMEAMTESCYYEGKPYSVGELVPQENCSMLCFCNGYGRPNPCFPMCQRRRIRPCEVGEELYSYNEENEYGCPCEMTACREINDD